MSLFILLFLEWHMRGILLLISLCSDLNFYPWVVSLSTQQLSSPLDSDEVDIWTNLDSRLFELLLKNNRTCFWTTQDCHGKRMRSGCSKGNEDLRDIFTQKKREKMIKIRHVEKKLLNSQCADINGHRYSR